VRDKEREKETKKKDFVKKKLSPLILLLHYDE
jgi:hypothetical protein